MEVYIYSVDYLYEDVTDDLGIVIDRQFYGAEVHYTIEISKDHELDGTIIISDETYKKLKANDEITQYIKRELFRSFMKEMN